jgi:hypothetical protein
VLIFGTLDNMKVIAPNAADMQGSRVPGKRRSIVARRCDFDRMGYRNRSRAARAGRQKKYNRSGTRRG